jgi:peptidoglycan/LPS O-acetylase OafA/YrhL
VLVTHSVPLRGGVDASFFGYDTISKVGVYVFFAVSGYLVTQSWQRDPAVVRFLARRALRIFPGLAGVVLLSVLALGPALTALPAGAYLRAGETWRYVSNIYLDTWYTLPGVFAKNPIPAVNGALWTLPDETRMYLALCLLGHLGLLRRRPTALVAAVALGVGALHVAAPRSDAYYLCDLGVYFFAGSFLASGGAGLRPRWPGAATLLAMAVLSAGRPAFHVVAWAAIPYLSLWLGLLPTRLSAAIGRRGDLSYGIYVYAFPIQQAVIALAGPKIAPALNLALVGGVTLLAAAASWRFVEAPALRRKPRRPARLPDRGEPHLGVRVAA